MRVAVVGATGSIGRTVVPALVRAGHDVVGLARTPATAALLAGWGAESLAADGSDDAHLLGLVEGADAVCNVAGHVPVGVAALRPGAWRLDDRLRTEGVRRVVAAARAAGVRRVVQGSVSYLYADQGDAWVAEQSPLAITRATEPASVGELHVQDFVCGSRTGVVLRLGAVIGDDPLTRRRLARRAVAVGDPEGWAHVIHVDDVGPAVVAALAVPGGVYNVGAEPVRRGDLVAAAAGRGPAGVAAPLLRRVGGARLEAADPVAAGQLRAVRVPGRLAAVAGALPRLLVRPRDAHLRDAVTSPDPDGGDPAVDQPGGPDQPGSDEDSGPSQAEQRRRRATVFGDVLPDVTGDERGDGDRGEESAGDEWLRRQVPPHHG